MAEREPNEPDNSKNFMEEASEQLKRHFREQGIEVVELGAQRREGYTIVLVPKRQPEAPPPAETPEE